MAIFMLAQTFIGVATSPYYSVLPAYLDENVHPKDMPVYLGVWSFANYVSPGIGMLIGGAFLSIYVDLKQVRHILMVFCVGSNGAFRENAKIFLGQTFRKFVPAKLIQS